MGHWQIQMGTTRICSSCGDSTSGTLANCPKDGTPFFSDEVMSRLGMVIKDHEIQGVIGEGGMGVVYRAQHVVIEKPVAIKVLYSHVAKQKEMVEQFIVEAKAASRIRHSNIIDVTDFGTTPEGLVFLVMEYLDGESLQDRLARVGCLPVFDAMNIIRQVAHGLDAAHELGIIHRDLKPANIFLCQREGRRRIVRRSSGELGPKFTVEAEQTFDLVKLLDFGIAKFMDLGPGVATRNGVLCGTPQYLSPEQAQEKPATAASDIYALGVVFYEMVTGSVPFDGKSMFEILKGHVAGVVVPPSQRAPHAGIDENLDAVIGCCLEKDPARRFASADELCDALDQCVSDRAFLRDAHRLPGIEFSGIDLSGAGVEARRETPAIEKGFSEVEGGRDLMDLPDITDLDERPGRRRHGRGPRETTRIRTGNKALRLLAVGAVLAAAAGVALWVMHGQGSRSDGASVAGTAAETPVAPANSTATTSGAGQVAAQSASSTSTSASVQAAAPTPAKAAAAGTPQAAAETPAAKGPAVNDRTSGPAQVAAADKTRDRSTERPGPAKVRGSTSGAIKIPAWALAGAPPVVPAPAEPSPPASAPAPAAAAPSPTPAPAHEPAVDAESLLRAAQQAWSRHHYGLAIRKAHAALEADPARVEAYQIISVSSCAIGATVEAREAATHLDEHKRKLVQGLCKSHGVAIE